MEPNTYPISIMIEKNYNILRLEFEIIYTCTLEYQDNRKYNFGLSCIMHGGEPGINFIPEMINNFTTLRMCK